MGQPAGARGAQRASTPGRPGPLEEQRTHVAVTPSREGAALAGAGSAWGWVAAGPP